MKKTTTLLYLGLVCILTFSAFFAGCTSTRVPAAVRPPLYSQEKLTAIDHWDNIAVEVAERVRKTLLDRHDLIGLPIYISAPDGGAFSRTFTGLLHTELVSRGMQVSQKPEPASLYLSYDVQVVSFNSSREGSFPTLGAGGLGLIGIFGGPYTSPSNNEVLVSVELVRNNRYAMHLSKYYYINDDDWEMYNSAPAFTEPDADGQWSRYARRTPAFGNVPGSGSGTQAPYYSNAHSQRGVELAGEYAGTGRRIDPAAAPTPIGKNGR